MFFPITNHAVARFRERVRDVPEDKARDEMYCCLQAASERRLRDLEKGKRTAMVPTGCCIFIGSRGKIVSVIKEFTNRE